jgi:hypothetical protein
MGWTCHITNPLLHPAASVPASRRLICSCVRFHVGVRDLGSRGSRIGGVATKLRFDAENWLFLTWRKIAKSPNRQISIAARRLAHVMNTSGCFHDENLRRRRRPASLSTTIPLPYEVSYKSPARRFHAQVHFHSVRRSPAAVALSIFDPSKGNQSLTATLG